MATHTRPRIVIRAGDAERLATLANALVGSKPELADELLRELARARTIAKAPANSVQMGSTLTYEADGRQRRVTLVYPDQADIDAGRVSVLTPVGAALIGLTEGQSIDWTARDGRIHRLKIVAVEAPAG